VSLTTRVLIALVLGFAIGAAIAAAGNPTLTSVGLAVEPVGTLFINAIRMTVIPLVVGSLVASVAAAPDASALGRVGRQAIVFFVVTLGIAALLTAIVAPPLLARIPLDPSATAALRASAANVASATTESVKQIPTVSKWLIDLVPVNPVRAAADGAMLPLILFSLLFGLAITRLAESSRTVLVHFFQGIADAALVLVRWALVLAPVGVFALALPLAIRLGLAAAGAVAGYIVVCAALTTAIAVLVLYPAARIFGGVSIARFARAALPAQAVAFSSRSSLAALPAMIESARSRLDAPDEVRGFLLPLAATTYRFGGAIGMMVGVLFVARLYGVDLSVAQLATVGVTVIVTTFSIPGIPSGSIIMMVPVLLAANIPPEGIGILIGVDTIPDMFRTTGNVTGDMAAAAIVGRQRGAPVTEVALAPTADAG
jgi:Na+/H+-dicarboxylate symporter